MSRIIAALLLSLALVSPATASVPSVSGEFIVVDGPGLGTILQVDNGVVEQEGISGTVVRDGACLQLHFHGTINEQSDPGEPCGWGRVAPRLTVLGSLAEQIEPLYTAEQLALLALRCPDEPDLLAAALVTLTGNRIDNTVRGLRNLLPTAVRVGELTAIEARAIKRAANRILIGDRRARALLLSIADPRTSPSVRAYQRGIAIRLLLEMNAIKTSMFTAIAIRLDQGPD